MLTESATRRSPTTWLVKRLELAQSLRRVGRAVVVVHLELQREHEVAVPQEQSRVRRRASTTVSTMRVAGAREQALEDLTHRDHPPFESAGFG